MVAAVTTAAQRQPLVMGKPHATTFEYLRTHWNVDPEKTLMVGDRYEDFVE